MGTRHRQPAIVVVLCFAVLGLCGCWPIASAPSAVPSASTPRYVAMGDSFLREKASGLIDPRNIAARTDGESGAFSMSDLLPCCRSPSLAALGGRAPGDPVHRPERAHSAQRKDEERRQS